MTAMARYVLTCTLALAGLLAGCGPEPLEGDDVSWVALPAGSFPMGCAPGDPDCEAFARMGFAEVPWHEVHVPAFEMTRTEITQYQYWKVTGDEPAYHPRCGDCPVENMPRHHADAKAFCEALGGRLPSEAEWEYAARGGTTTPYACGDDPSCVGDTAWYLDNQAVVPGRPAGSGPNHPHPVAGKAPNAFGLFDMAGNVQEWTADCSHDDFAGAPADGSAWTTGGDCSRHVFKGCAYNGPVEACRPSYRYWDLTDIRGIADGFRCARDVQNR
jgi:formylglycine-generating enzyme required for sulfatase activity